MLNALRSDKFSGVVTLLLAGMLAWQTPWLSALDRRIFDQGMLLADETPSARVSVIAVDAESESRLGPWPWSRDIDAHLIDQLAAAGARLIAYTPSLAAAQRNNTQAHVERLQQAHAEASLSLADAGLSPLPQAFDQLGMALQRTRVALDADARLTASLSKAGNVWLPLLPAATQAATGAWQMPLDGFARAAAGSAPWLSMGDIADGVVRRPVVSLPPLAQPRPAFPLALAAAGTGLEPGALQLPTDASGRMLSRYYRAPAGKPAFAITSFADVYQGRVDVADYRDRIVLIGTILPGRQEPLLTPLGVAMPPVLALAHQLSSILQRDGISRPQWAEWAGLGAALLASLYLLLVLPRMTPVMAALCSGLLFGLLLLTELLLLLGLRLWLPLGAAASVVILGQLLSLLLRGLTAETPRARPVAGPQMQAMALLQQGQLDAAFDVLRQCPPHDSMLEPLYKLGLAYERKQQPDQAAAVYRHLAQQRPDYRDLQQRQASLSQPRPPVAGSGQAVSSAPEAGVQQLGRYQLDKVLGKGAMGVVYLGRDPTIGRVVAVKTMALAEEFDSTDLDEVRKRFFREAETAGRLNHPNIVTIYDAAEEQGLAYIAMEFLKGRDLGGWTAAGQLLPPARALEIAVQVAEALDYAHAQNVVHRDIKPANIMYEPDSGMVKVTDFGVARITDASKTRTGMVLGTPSYMSPEQLSGKKVDGRSDLFSLASTLFQLLTGKLPFSGDSMAELMFRITNQAHPDIQQLQPGLPAVLKLVLDKALAKKPEDRFQSGAEFAAALRRSLAAMKER
jgi:CHASE2 domain-containing sensor protein/tRNA A-37 threonylcarbamoyl transferase component Bud32